MKKTRKIVYLIPTLLLALFLALAVLQVPAPAAHAAAPTADRIATGVAEAKAVAATLTAEIPVDRVATDVAEARAVAATLTAGAPADACVCACATAVVSETASASTGDYGPTQHCKARTGYATIELRNIVTNVKSLVFTVDGKTAATVPYAKYGCIYLKDGKYLFQWKSSGGGKQSNARSFIVQGSDAWYTDSVRADGVRNPYDAWLDVNKPEPTLTATPSPTPTP